jgi:hypothetical protein
MCEWHGRHVTRCTVGPSSSSAAVTAILSLINRGVDGGLARRGWALRPSSAGLENVCLRCQCSKDLARGRRIGRASCQAVRWRPRRIEGVHPAARDAVEDKNGHSDALVPKRGRTNNASIVRAALRAVHTSMDDTRRDVRKDRGPRRHVGSAMTSGARRAQWHGTAAWHSLASQKSSKHEVDRLDICKRVASPWFVGIVAQNVHADGQSRLSRARSPTPGPRHTV